VLQFQRAAAQAAGSWGTLFAIVVYPALLAWMQYFAAGVLYCVLSVCPIRENSAFYSAIPTPMDCDVRGTG